MNRAPSIVFFLLCLAFLIYSTTIYFELSDSASNKTANKEAGEGKLVWQKYNCQSCHQMYGLGGYLGPDLTNVSSRLENEVVLEAIIRSGNERMPSYSIDKVEMQALLSFFREMDRTGSADPRNFRNAMNGMIYSK